MIKVFRILRSSPKLYRNVIYTNVGLGPTKHSNCPYRPDDGGSKDLWNVGKLLSTRKTAIFVLTAVRTSNPTVRIFASDKSFIYPQGLYSNPGSPLLGGNTPSIPQLVRQKTWSIGSIHELDDARASMSAPPRTSSPLQSQQQVVQNLEHLSLNNKGPAVVDRLREACAKIHEALSMLNSSKDNCVSTSWRTHFHFVILSGKVNLGYHVSLQVWVCRREQSNNIWTNRLNFHYT
jgi:hypothetical protein